jgi:hypothetical protein
LLLLFSAPATQRATVLWFAGLTISISVALRFVRAVSPVPVNDHKYEDALQISSPNN